MEPQSQAGDICPLCGGKLVKAGSIKDDLAKPSKNSAVWNRSICANLLFNDDTIICTQCWMAYSEQSHLWERSSELPDSFYRPLSTAIRKFPAPPAREGQSSAVYSQQVFFGATAKESIAYWCADSTNFLSNIRAYAGEHNLVIHVDEQERIPGQVFVSAETRPVP